MKSYEMVETLSEKAHVSLEQAKDALEKSNWDMLDAAIYLERTKGSMNAPTYPQGPGYQYVSSQQNSFGGQFRQPPFPPNPPYPPQPGFKQPPRGNFPPNPGRQPRASKLCDCLNRCDLPMSTHVLKNIRVLRRHCRCFSHCFSLHVFESIPFHSPGRI